MLTRDLLRVHRPAGTIKPLFADPADPAVQGVAGALLDLYAASIGCPHSGILEESMPLVNAYKDRKLSAGFRKVIEDFSRFSSAVDRDYPAVRHQLFAEASRRIREGANLPVFPDEFRTALFSGQEPWCTLKENIFPDLPDYERLMSVPEWTPEMLIGMYNCVLAQSLVLYASSLTVTLSDPDTAKIRRFFKYLRFFQLLASVEKCEWRKNEPTSLRIRIDGPVSILTHSNRYGLSLASFLPALFQLEKWKFSADLNLNGSYTFTLDQKSGLSRRFGRLSAYIPEEIRIFADYFAKQETKWRIDQNTPFLRIGKTQDFIFPDVTFTDGTHTVYMELFHQWHLARLSDRLKYLETNPGFPLLIGADRTLPRPEKEKIEQHPEYKKRLFLFRDFPGAGNVEKLLDGMTKV